MQLTHHASQRITERTRLEPEDVLSILSAGAYVELGSEHLSRFVLFYSSPDKKTKIAVLKGDRIMTVWNSHFNPPLWVRVPTKEDKLVASEKIRTLYREQNTHGEFSSQISLIVGQVTVHTFRGDKIPASEMHSTQKVVKKFNAILSGIANLIEEHREDIIGRVYYRIYLKDPESYRFQYFHLHHGWVRKLLKAA